jgi:hypothetical protein
MIAYRAEFDDGLVTENESEEELDKSIKFYCSRRGFLQTEKRKMVKKLQVEWKTTTQKSKTL